MKVNLSVSTSQYTANGATDKIGVRFTNMPPPTNPWLVLPSPLTNNISQVYSSVIITDTMNWTTISGSFIADSAYNYIVIGNFFTDNFTNILTIYPNSSSYCYGSYYFIDDVCVSTDSSTCFLTVAVDEEDKNEKIIISPNPAIDKITITCPDNLYLSLSIFNVIGELKIKREFVKNNDEVDINSLSKGIYIIRLTGDNWTGKKKIIKE
jgi:hypothetical protein